MVLYGLSMTKTNGGNMKLKGLARAIKTIEDKERGSELVERLGKLLDS